MLGTLVMPAESVPQPPTSNCPGGRCSSMSQNRSGVSFKRTQRPLLVPRLLLLKNFPPTSPESDLAFLLFWLSLIISFRSLSLSLAGLVAGFPGSAIRVLNRSDRGLSHATPRRCHTVRVGGTAGDNDFSVFDTLSLPSFLWLCLHISIHLSTAITSAALG